MAEQLFGTIAACLLPQSAYGTVNATLAALTTSVNTAQGLIVGLSSEGVRGTGITLPKRTREQLDLARVGVSRQAGQLEQVIREGFAISFPFGGARNTATGGSAVDSDFNLSTHWPGVDAALRASGLVGANDGGGIGYIYSPGAATFASLGFWYSGRFWVFKDCLCKTTIKYVAQRAPVAKVEIERLGALVSNAAQTLGTVTPGNQATAVSKVAAVANAWGATRSFSECEIVISPAQQTLGLSNDAAERVIQIGTDVDIKTTIVSDDGNPIYEDDILALGTVPTADMTFGVPNNTATAAGATCNAHALSINNIEGDVVEVSDAVGTIAAHAFTGRATIGGAGTQGAEFSLKFY